MPHDKNGNLLKAGDRVLVEYTVSQVSPGEEFCNLTLKTVELMPPYTDEVAGRSTVTLNAKQVSLVVSVEGETQASQ